MPLVLPWLAFTVLMFVEFGVLACSVLGTPRRPHFYLRLLGASVTLLTLALVTAFGTQSGLLPQRDLGPLWLALSVAALAAAPVVCYRPFQSFGDNTDSDGDGGGGPGSGPTPPRAPEPLGGLPLPDADPARARRRDQHRQPSWEVTRRPSVEPVRPRRPARLGWR